MHLNQAAQGQFAIIDRDSGTLLDQSAAVRAQPPAEDKVPEEGRRGDHELVFINAPFYAIIAPSSRATAKTDQLDAPVRLTAAFVVVLQPKGTR